MKTIRRLEPGSPLYAEDYNSLIDEIERLGKMTVEGSRGGAADTNSGGQNIVLPRQFFGIWARVTNPDSIPGGPWAWRQVRPDLNGGFADMVDSEGPRHGTAVMDSLYHPDHTATVANSAVVFIVKGVAHVDGATVQQDWLVMGGICCGDSGGTSNNPRQISLCMAGPDALIGNGHSIVINAAIFTLDLNGTTYRHATGTGSLTIDNMAAVAGTLETLMLGARIRVVTAVAGNPPVTTGLNFWAPNLRFIQGGSFNHAAGYESFMFDPGQLVAAGLPPPNVRIGTPFGFTYTYPRDFAQDFAMYWGGASGGGGFNFGIPYMLDNYNGAVGTWAVTSF